MFYEKVTKGSVYAKMQLVFLEEVLCVHSAIMCLSVTPDKTIKDFCCISGKYIHTLN